MNCIISNVKYTTNYNEAGLKLDKDYVVSVLHQDEGGVGKSTPAELNFRDILRPSVLHLGTRGKSQGSRVAKPTA